MQYLTKLSTVPTEPVSIGAMYDWLKQDPGSDDAVLAGNITGARDWIERFQRKSLVSEQYRLVLDRFPYFAFNPDLNLYEQGGEWDGFWNLPGGVLHGDARRFAISLPIAPLVSLDSIIYRDENGVLQTLDPSLYQTVTGDDVAPLLYPADRTYWPITCLDPAAIAITFTAGYTAANLPPNTLIALKMLVAAWYGARDGKGDIPPVVKKLLWMDQALEL